MSPHNPAYVDGTGWELDPVTDQQVLVRLFEIQRDQADPASVERMALNVTLTLLLMHRPALDDQCSTGHVCVECWEAWPCRLYMIVKREVDRE